MITDDMELVREYATSQSERAFEQLVARHLNMVYSTALRRVDDIPLAQEITQAVFIILARKAQSFGPKTILSGWLYHTTRYTATNALKIQRRRQKREQEAHMQSLLNEPSSQETWQQIAPLLETAMDSLSEGDRNAVVLRFFDDKSLSEVGAALGVSEAAAKMRVNRALEKLRNMFTKRGVRLTTAIIAGAVSANSVQAAPAGLATTISAVAMAKGTAAGGSTLILVKGALKLMAWTKLKTAIIITAVVVLAGTMPLIIKAAREAKEMNNPLPSEARDQLEKQRAAMKTIYLEYTEAVSRSAYSYAATNSVYFEGNCFHVFNNDREFAFDGRFGWQGGEGGRLELPVASLTKFLASDSSNPSLTSLYWTFLYFKAASIYAPIYGADLNGFPSLQPLLLHYLEKSDKTIVEQQGSKLRVVVQIGDPDLLNFQKIDLTGMKKKVLKSPNTPEFKSNELATIEKLQTLVPRRTVSFLLDPQYGYAVTEREEWTAIGQRILRVKSDNWKYYEDKDIWLPGRCVVAHYTTPYTFKEYSDQPVQTDTINLTTVSFSKKEVTFDLSKTPKYMKAGTEIYDQTIPEAMKKENHTIVLTVGADGTLLRNTARRPSN